MDALRLEPVRVAARIEIPVDDVQPRVPFGRRPDHVVHLQVRRALGAQREPEDVLDSRAFERLECRLDRRRECRLVVVVAERHDDGASELQRGEEVDERRRANALVGAAVADESTAHRELEVEVDSSAEERPRVGVVLDGGRNGVADHRDALGWNAAHRSGEGRWREGDPRECDRRQHDPAEGGPARRVRPGHRVPRQSSRRHVRA